MVHADIDAEGLPGLVNVRSVEEDLDAYPKARVALLDVISPDINCSGL